MRDALVILLALAIGGGVIAWLVYYLRKRHQTETLAQQGQFRQLLLQDLQKHGTSNLDFEGLVGECQIPRPLADEVAQAIYARFCAKFVGDGQISETERQKLRTLSKVLMIDPSLSATIESRCKERLYAHKAGSLIAEGEIQQAEAESLEQLRGRLGLSRARALSVVETPARDGYRRLFREIVSDGVVTEAELEQIRRYREALGITEAEAREIIGGEANHCYRELFRRAMSDGRLSADELQEMRRFREALGLTEAEGLTILQPDALNFFRQCFYSVVQDGQITSAEERKLDWIRSQFGLREDQVKPYLDQVQRLKLFATYREGNLPSLQTRKILESGEICHWEGSCSFSWDTPAKRKMASGELTVTSNRVYLSAAGKNFSFGPAKIMDIEPFGNGLRLQTEGHKGTGDYFIDDPEYLEAVLFGLVRKHKYLICQNFSSSQSRHIPDAVKKEVWYRDGGRCVRCSAVEYLEFDHIIAHGKGGANTVKNVQLLCRKCNLLKSDRI